MALTAKQQRFVDAYIDCLNATEAARRAMYSEPNKQGPRMLVNVGIRSAIDAALREQTLPKDEVLARLSAIARSDIRDLLTFGDDGTVTGLRLHRGAPLHLIKSITPTKYGDKIELHDPVGPLIKLGEAYGVFRDRTADSLEQIAAAATAAQQALHRKLDPGDAADPAAGVPGEPGANGGAGTAA